MDESAERVDYIGPGMSRVVTKVSEEEIRLAKRWNEGGIEGKQEFLDAMLDKAKTEEEIEAIKKLIATLDELKIARDVLNSQKQHGFTDPKQYQKLLAELDAAAAKAKNNISDDMQRHKEFINYKNEKMYAGLSSDDKIYYLRNNQMVTAKEGLASADAQARAYKQEIENIRQAAKEFAATGGPSKLKAGTPEFMKALQGYVKQYEEVQAKAVKNEEKRFALQKWIFNMEQEILSLEKKQQEFYDKRNQALDAEIQKTKRLTAIQKDSSVYWQEVKKVKNHDAFNISGIGEGGVAQVTDKLPEIEEYIKSIGHFQKVFEDARLQIPGIGSGSLDYLFKNMDSFKEAIKKLQKTEGDLTEEQFNKIFKDAGIDYTDYPNMQKILYEQFSQLKNNDEDDYKNLLNRLANFGKIGDTEELKKLLRQFGADSGINFEEENLEALLKDFDKLVAKSKELQGLKIDVLDGSRASGTMEYGERLRLLAEEQTRLEIINKLKEAGQKIDKKAVDELVKKQMALKNLQGEQTLFGQFQNQSFQLYLKSLRANGKQKEAANAEAIRNAEKTVGGTLTDDQKSTIYKLTNLQFEIDKLSKIEGKRAPEIMTNSLTQRGRFQIRCGCS
jgi:hypothetical protein